MCVKFQLELNFIVKIPNLFLSVNEDRFPGFNAFIDRLCFQFTGSHIWDKTEVSYKKVKTVLS